VPEGVINLLEAIEIDEMYGKVVTTHQRANRERIPQTFNELGTIGQAGQHVVMREEPDAPVCQFFFLGSTIPSDGRDADGAADQ